MDGNKRQGVESSILPNNGKIIPSETSNHGVSEGNMNEVEQQQQEPNHDGRDAKSMKANDENIKKKKKKKKPQFITNLNVINARLQSRLLLHPTTNFIRRSFQIDWISSSNPVPIEDEKYMQEKIVLKKSYAPLTKTEKEEIMSQIRSKNIQMTLGQVISLRAAVLRQSALANHFKLKANAEHIHQQYVAGACILSLSQKVNCPPLNVFRKILLVGHGYSKKKIKNCLRNPEEHLSQEEQKHLILAERNDCVSPINQEKILKYAEAFEDILAQWLSKRGVNFVRQRQLEEEQVQEFGKPYLTPDFLLLDNVTINGSQIKWIDCKANYGSNTSFNVKLIKKQSYRYKNCWGDGAILFLQGFSEALDIDGCTLLNASGMLDDATRLVISMVEALNLVQ